MAELAFDMLSIDLIGQLLSHIKSNHGLLDKNSIFSRNGYVYKVHYMRLSQADKIASRPLLPNLLLKSLDTDSIIRTLGQLKRAALDLSLLSKTVEDSVTGLQKSLMPHVLEQGMQRLPDELLVRIFELSMDDDQEIQFGVLPRHILHVCRRFRQLGFRLPDLWTNVRADGNWINNPVLPLQLKYSGSRPLDVRLILTGNVLDCATSQDASPEKDMQLINTIIPSRGRWGSLQIPYIEKHHLQGPLQHLSSACSGSALTALETLYVGYNITSSSEFSPSDDIDMNFFSEWNAPALRSFEAENFIPKADIACLSKLERCSLSVSTELLYDSEDYVFDTRALVDFLRPIQTLEELELNLEGIHAVKSLSAQTGVPVSLLLPNIKKLSLDINDTPPESFCEFFGALQIPNVSEIAIKLRLKGGVQEWLDTIFPKGREYPNLTSLTFDVEDKPHSSSQSPFNSTLRRFANSLQELSINAHSSNVGGLALHKTGALKRVVLRDMTVNLAPLLFHWTPDLESFEVVGCKGTNWEALAKALPQGKQMICRD